jgi:hypothetical protein
MPIPDSLPEFESIRSYLRHRTDLSLFGGSGATVEEIASALPLLRGGREGDGGVKIILWNMLDRGLITKHGRCMDEATFTNA